MLETLLIAVLSAATVPPEARAVSAEAPVAVKAPVVVGPTPPSVPSVPVPGVTAPAPANSKAAPSTLDGGTPAQAADDPEDGPRVLPTLSQKALCTELRRSAKDRSSALRKLEDERKAIAAERERLKSVQAEIVAQRELLRSETARLEGVLDKQPTAAPAPEPAAVPAPARTGKKSAVGDVESLAKTVHAMKTEQAAVLLAKLDRDLSAQVLAQMKPADAGAVLDKVKPELAAQLMADMAALPRRKKGAHP